MKNRKHLFRAMLVMAFALWRLANPPAAEARTACGYWACADSCSEAEWVCQFCPGWTCWEDTPPCHIPPWPASPARVWCWDYE